MATIDLDGWPYEGARSLIENALTRHDNTLYGDGGEDKGLAGEAARRDGEIRALKSGVSVIGWIGGILAPSVVGAIVWFFLHQPPSGAQIQKMLNQQEMKFERDTQEDHNPPAMYYYDRHGHLHRMHYSAGIGAPQYEYSITPR